MNLVDRLLPGGADARRRGLEALVDEWMGGDFVSDGVSDFRVVTDEPMRVGIVGLVWSIEQTQHAFFLELRSDGADPDEVVWTLHFDLRASVRRVRNAVYEVEDPTRQMWAFSRTGRGSPLALRIG